MKKNVVAFVTAAPISNRTTEENLGIGYLAAYCEKYGFQSVIIDGWIENLAAEEIVARILALSDLLFVGFSCYQLNKATTKEVIDLLKESGLNVPNVAGGYGPTFYPEEFLEIGVDVISLSEGEHSILGLCHYFQTGEGTLDQISGVAFMQDGVLVKTKPVLVENLDELPFPLRTTIDYVIQSKTPVNILTSRGCKANCTFCSVSAFWRMS